MTAAKDWERGRAPFSRLSGRCSHDMARRVFLVKYDQGVSGQIVLAARCRPRLPTGPSSVTEEAAPGEIAGQVEMAG